MDEVSNYMATISSVGEVQIAGPVRRGGRMVTAFEVLLVYAGILLYIWQWQSTHPWAWVVLAAAVLASHLAHHDRLRDLGLIWTELGSSAQWALGLAVALYVPLLVYGFGSHRVELLLPSWRGLESFGRYFVWCAFQQYLTQSYFHRRLMSVTRSPHRSSLLVGLMFGSAHLPNPILMVATTLGGFLFAEIYARHRNIWPLAFVQAAGGVLIAALAPPSLIHNMRVGPGYFFYRLR